MMNNPFQDPKKMQEVLQKIAKEMESRFVTAEAGGGRVKVRMNLKKQVQELHMDPALFNEKPDVVSGLVIAAFNQAVFDADEEAKKEMMNMSKHLS